MERSLERFLDIETVYDLAAKCLMKPKSHVEPLFGVISQNAAMVSVFKGYQDRNVILESILKYSADQMEALIVATVAFDQLFFATAVCRHMMNYLPQYKSHLNLPPSKTWSTDYLNSLNTPFDELEKEMCESAFRRVAPHLQHLVMENDTRTHYNELLSCAVELSTREMLGVIKMACV